MWSDFTRDKTVIAFLKGNYGLVNIGIRPIRQQNTTRTEELFSLLKKKPFTTTDQIKNIL